MSQPDVTTQLKIKMRPSTPVTLQLPDDTLATLQQIATSRDMTVEALLKLYIGQALRHGGAQHFADRILDLTAQVFGRHGQSSEQSIRSCTTYGTHRFCSL